MAIISGSTGWNGGSSSGSSAKSRRKMYVANRRSLSLYNPRTGRGKRYSQPGTRDLEF